MNENTFTIRPLVWTPRRSGNVYEDWACPIPRVRYVIAPVGVEWMVLGMDQSTSPPTFPTEKIAKAACQTHWEHTLSAALQPAETRPRE